MADLFNEAGEKVEGAMTKDEIATATKTAEDAAVEQYKKDNPPPAVVEKKQDDAAAVTEEMPAWAKEIKSTVDKLAGTVTTTTRETIADRYAGADKENRDKFQQKFDRLTGYEDTPEGLAARAEDARTLAFGENAPVIDVAALGGTGSGRNVDDAGKKTPSEADKTVRTLLGITPKDVETFAPKGEHQGDKK